MCRNQESGATFREVIIIMIMAVFSACGGIRTGMPVLTAVMEEGILGKGGLFVAPFPRARCSHSV